VVLCLLGVVPMGWWCVAQGSHLRLWCNHGGAVVLQLFAGGVVRQSFYFFAWCVLVCGRDVLWQCAIGFRAMVCGGWGGWWCGA